KGRSWSGLRPSVRMRDLGDDSLSREGSRGRALPTPALSYPIEVEWFNDELLARRRSRPFVLQNSVLPYSNHWGLKNDPNAGYVTVKVIHSRTVEHVEDVHVNRRAARLSEGVVQQIQESHVVFRVRRHANEKSFSPLTNGVSWRPPMQTALGH